MEIPNSLIEVKQRESFVKILEKAGRNDTRNQTFVVLLCRKNVK